MTGPRSHLVSGIFQLYSSRISQTAPAGKRERFCSLLPFVLMAETPAFLTSSLFLDIERSTKILYDIKKLELSAVLFVYIDKEQLYKLEFLGVRSQG